MLLDKLIVAVPEPPGLAVVFWLVPPLPPLALLVPGKGQNTRFESE